MLKSAEKSHGKIFHRMGKKKKQYLKKKGPRGKSLGRPSPWERIVDK